MEKGVLKEQGTHLELMRKEDGIYRKLQMQGNNIS
jgi:ABC-type multidrug transport system fused ATPase/permease subunit